MEIGLVSLLHYLACWMALCTLMPPAYSNSMQQIFMTNKWREIQQLWTESRTTAPCRTIPHTAHPNLRWYKKRSDHTTVARNEDPRRIPDPVPNIPELGPKSNRPTKIKISERKVIITFTKEISFMRATKSQTVQNKIKWKRKRRKRRTLG